MKGILNKLIVLEIAILAGVLCWGGVVFTRQHASAAPASQSKAPDLRAAERIARIVLTAEDGSLPGDEGPPFTRLCLRHFVQNGPPNTVGMFHPLSLLRCRKRVGSVRSARLVGDPVPVPHIPGHWELTFQVQWARDAGTAKFLMTQVDGEWKVADWRPESPQLTNYVLTQL